LKGWTRRTSNGGSGSTFGAHIDEEGSITPRSRANITILVRKRSCEWLQCKAATSKRPLHLILLALHTNLGEAQAKLDATAAARTGGATPNLPDPVRVG